MGLLFAERRQTPVLERERAAMKEGLMWFDNDPRRSLVEKVGRAAERYSSKFGRSPDTCYVNPRMVLANDTSDALCAVRVRPVRTIPIHHFLVGIGSTKRSNTRKRTP
jgi:hypothetical protein